MSDTYVFVQNNELFNALTCFQLFRNLFSFTLTVNTSYIDFINHSGTQMQISLKL